MESNSEIEIRDVDPQGPDALALLHEASVDAWALYPELYGESKPEAKNGPLPDRGIYVIAYRAELPLACGALCPFSESVAEVRRMYVHREHRRQGLARTVLSHLVSEARLLGYSSLVLETGNKQHAAIALYEGCGFQRTPAFGDYVNDATSVCFELSLEREA